MMNTEDDAQQPLPADLESASGEELARIELVVIGSSAGGIEALSLLLSSLRSNFPAPIVLAQHLDPRRPSNLDAVLQRRSPMPVVLVTDKAPLEPSKVYIVPSNRHIAISDGHVHIEGDHGNRPRPSVDLLLSTAAESYGERLVAIILTGSGTDGASGAIDVKNAGGIVIIQNPETARYPSMPQALPPTAVDFTANVEEMGRLLYDLIGGQQLRETSEKIVDPLRDILNLISQRSNIDFRQYKPPTILRRIGRRMVSTRSSTLEEYRAYLEKNNDEVANLVMAFLIKVTEFFRDAEAFVFLKNEVIPQLIERNSRTRSIRIWSAGCATGEEPYSLALLVAELLGSQLPDWTVKIFATDLDEGAISFARRGCYPASMLKNMPDEYRDRYFEPVGGGYRVSKTLRQRVIFGLQDISRGAPFPRIDLVVCRNLLIYFQPSLQQHILDTFAYSLGHTGGYLFLGKAETARPAQADFEQVNRKFKIYRCTSTALATAQWQVARLGTSAHSHLTKRVPLRHAAPGQAREGTGGEQSPQLGTESEPKSEAHKAFTDLDIQRLRRTNELLFRSSPVGVAVIDRNYRVITINTAARRLLHIFDAGMENDFLHSARALPYSLVRSAIDNAFHGQEATSLPELELDPLVGDGKYVDLSISPVEVEDGTVELVIINVQDATETVQVRRHLETVQAEQEHLVAELQDTNTRLSEMNKEMQDTNEELQAANEEMMLTHEELQATNEEFEATNEELQATNEELETSNEELQATNEELETTNDEMNSRTQELQELSRHLADERVRLGDMVELAPFYIWVFRGKELILEAANPHSQRLLSGGQFIKRPAEEVFLDWHSGKLTRLLREAYEQDEVRESQANITLVPTDNGLEERYFSYTIVPTHDSEAQVDGVVVYGEDITDRLARQAEESLEMLKLMVEHADQIALAIYDANTTRLLQASPFYLDLLERVCGYARDTIIGRTWREMPFTPPSDDAEDIFRATAASGQTRHLREVPVTKDKVQTLWDLTLAPILTQQDVLADGARAAGYIVISAVDVTHQVQERQELERLDQLRDQFLSLASHELRTPLVPLMGYSDLLARLATRKEQEADAKWDKRVGQYVGKFKTQLQHVTRLIDDLFDVARLQNGKFTLRQEKVDLRDVLNKAVDSARMLTQTHKIEYKVEGKGSYMVQGDEARLVQVIQNLLQNAIRYAPNSHKIDVRLCRASTRGPGKKQAKIEVQDYGPGIDPEALPSIFARFYQASGEPQLPNNGLGLGLFIAKAITEQHGGTVNAESTLGKGSTFTVTLPLIGGQ